MSNDFLKGLQKINPLTEIVETSSLGNIKDYISTGSYSLNASMTGDIYKGVPTGRTVTFQGKSSTGKSYIMANIFREAQKKGYKICAWQSENASDKFFYQRLGVDANAIYDMPIDTLEELKNQAVQTIDYFTKLKESNPEQKFLLALDSLGNLMTEKEKANALEGHNAQDMGLRAKLCRLLGRLITMPLAKIDVPFVILNHTYTNATGYVPVEVPVGGEGAIYISSIMCQMTKEKVKEEKVLTGNILHSITTKNRLIPEGRKANLFVDFETGLNPYYGLLDYAVDGGFMEKVSTQYHVKHLDKRIFEKNIYVPEVWEPILDGINDYIKTTCKYSSISDNILKPEDVDEDGVVVEEVEKKTKKSKK